MSMPSFRRCSLLVKNHMLKRRLRALKEINMGMENELSFLEGEVDFLYGELQEAQWQLHAANRELQQLRADADRRRGCHGPTTAVAAEQALRQA